MEINSRRALVGQMKNQFVKECEYFQDKSQESEPTTQYSQRVLQCASTKHLPAPKSSINPRLSISRTAKANNPLKPTVISPFCEVKQETSACFPSKIRSMKRHKSLRRYAKAQLKENVMQSARVGSEVAVQLRGDRRVYQADS